MIQVLKQVRCKYRQRKYSSSAVLTSDAQVAHQGTEESLSDSIYYNHLCCSQGSHVPPVLCLPAPTHIWRPLECTSIRPPAMHASSQVSGQHYEKFVKKKQSKRSTSSGAIVHNCESTQNLPNSVLAPRWCVLVSVLRFTASCTLPKGAHLLARQPTSTFAAKK